jgi:predicted anti-sigma-YlaC factor YlaD
MDCGHWNQSLVGRLYEDISPEEDAALEAHLSGCAGCRATLEEFRRVRTVLDAGEPEVQRVPRVVVLRDRSRWRHGALAASILCAALLAGAGAGAGYALGQRRATEIPPTAAVASAGVPAGVPSAVPASLDKATEALIRSEVERRVAALAASQVGQRAVSPTELRAELARFERKVNDTRATDLDYMLGQIEASEIRTGSRIGKTNQALRDVALASNGYVSAQ